MRVPLEWLHEYCEPHMDARTLAQRLALTGTEVERVEHHGVPSTDHFVVGHVLERHKHPDADRLSVCMVDVGGSTPAQIVCGAPNVAAGLTVGVARPGRRDAGRHQAKEGEASRARVPGDDPVRA